MNTEITDEGGHGRTRKLQEGKNSSTMRTFFTQKKRK